MLNHIIGLKLGILGGTHKSDLRVGVGKRNASSQPRKGTPLRLYGDVGPLCTLAQQRRAFSGKCEGNQRPEGTGLT